LFMTEVLYVTPKATEQNLTARIKPK